MMLKNENNSLNQELQDVRERYDKEATLSK